MTATTILITLEAAEFDSYLFDALDRALKHHSIAIPPPAPIPEPDRFITKKDVAALFGVSEVSVWDWEKKGLLTGYRIGNLVRYKYSEVMASPKMIKRGQKQC